MEHVCQLKQSLYELKLAGNVWNKGWNQVMEELGYEKLKSDYCCFVQHEGEDFSILLRYNKSKGIPLCFRVKGMRGKGRGLKVCIPAYHHMFTKGIGVCLHNIIA